ncbi:GNAT family N-acetyltransferase [Sedimenticola hydrogenitrophicus]|uniref:GNAT family N-acetyltransferase n=1 Tax=Sedimenticola hydrogenitrophicus TaxID=2967975 RepID=UPI0023B11A2B
MTEATPITYRIEAVRAVHNRATFDCGHPFLNTYLTQFARQNDQNGVARAYVAVPAEAGNPVGGYYTLSAGAVAFDNLPPAIRRGLPKYPVPVVRIGELAVDNALQGQGLGSALLLDALGRIANAAEEVPVWAIVVDPIDQQASSFYLHHGFAALPDCETLFLTMKDATTWLSEHEG